MIEKAYAFDPISPTGSVGTPGSLTDILNHIGTNALSIITLLAGILAVILLIWYGIQYITAGGSPDKAKAARTGIINSVIGIVIIVAAYFIIRVAMGIGNQLESSTTNTPIPTQVATATPTPPTRRPVGD